MKIKLLVFFIFYILDLLFLLGEYNLNYQGLTENFTVGHSIFILVVNLYFINTLFDLRNFLNPFVFFTWNSVMFNFIGNCFPFQFDRYENVRELFFLGNFHMIFQGLGCILFAMCNLKFVQEQRSLQMSRFNDLIQRTELKKLNIFRIFLFLGVGLIFFHFIFIARAIPALHDDAENFRVESKSGKGQILIFGINLCLVGAIYYCLQRVKLKKLISVNTLLVLLSVCIVIMLCGYRSNALQIFVIFFIAIQLHKRRYIKYSFLIFSILLLLVIVGVTGYIRGASVAGVNIFEEVDFSTLLMLTFSRSAVGNTGMDEVFRYFKNGGDYIYGYSFYLDSITLLPGDQPNFGLWVKDLLRMDFDGGSTMLGDYGIYFINFGYIGVAVLTVLNTYFLNWTYKSLAKRANTSLLFFSTLIIFSFTFTGIGEIQSFMYHTMIMSFFNIVLYLRMWFTPPGSDKREIQPQVVVE